MMPAEKALQLFDEAPDFDSKIQVFCDYLTDILTVKEKLKPREKIQFKGGAVKSDRLHRHNIERSGADQSATPGGHVNPPTRHVRITNSGRKWVT